MTKADNMLCPNQCKDFKEKLDLILTNVNKPSSYIGQEIGSYNKDWDSATTRAVIAFPDLYEIGISNMGLRILYDKINKYDKKNFLADRVYAPAMDFKDELKKNNMPLFAVESYKPLSEFDIVAFSLQYELSYPTILAMLEMGNIPIKSSDRSEVDSIVVAGGPGAYNPEALVDFVDAFIIGDGETITTMVLDVVDNAKKLKLSREETLLELSKLDGIYVPKFYSVERNFARPRPIRQDVPEFIKKRVDDIDTTDYPVCFPVSYSTSVHDRAVVEIRRGCGRMCRYCQSCYVNLPVRERSQDNVTSLVEQALCNTGYEEYSLLSLSSNDYKDIENLVRKLNNEHAKSGASVSLPSQRADNFSLELAELVQAVRKSTITLAVEAGSQRLRDVINKNLTEEQILNAVTTVYKAGWKSVKLYFMIGLPTEQTEDIDAIADLLKRIKEKVNELKQELNLKKFLNITCTVSIFVPKSFTPFQWFAQDNIELINEKIKYLRSKTKGIRDLKLNFHDTFLSHLEAVFSRGDRRLCRLIEKMYQKGSYLDAWNEHFNQGLWKETADELGLNLQEFSEKTFDLDEELPWEIINIGVKKDWLKSEYLNSLKEQNTSPCESGCVDCGVCTNMSINNELSPSVRKNLAHVEKDIVTSAFNNDDIDERGNIKVYSSNGYRYRLLVQKVGDLKYISHLDWQKLLYSTIRKAKLKINFSQGYNPTPKLSVAVALPLFIQGENEYIDIELQEEIAENIIKDSLNKFLPENGQIKKIVKISKQEKSIEKNICWATYKAIPVDKSDLKKIELSSIVKEVLSKNELIIEKISKKGIKNINIRPAIHSISLNEDNDELVFILRAGQGLSCDNQDNDNRLDSGKEIFSGSLRADNFLMSITPEMKWNITRKNLLDCNFKELIN